MKKRFRTGKKIIAMVLAVALFATLWPRMGQSAHAAVNENECIPFGTYSASHPIENGVVFVGVYLINRKGLTDDLMQQAKETGSDTAQDTMYYKSEFGGGSWFSLSDSGMLVDITEEGTPIEEEEMQDLLVKYYVDEKGVLTDVYDNAEKNPFDLTDPYDLRNLPELESLKMQYTFSKELDTISELEFLNNRTSFDQGKVRADVYYYQIITTFFGLNMQDAETAKLDEQLDRLYQCYKALKNQKNETEAAIVYSLMGKVDAARRALVFEKLSQLDENAVGELYDMATGSCYTAKGNFKTLSTLGTPSWLVPLKTCLDHDFSSTTGSERDKKKAKNYTDWYIPVVPDEKEDDEEEEESYLIPDNSILDALSTCMESCQTSYSEYSAKALKDSDSVLDHIIYEYSMDVIASASAAGLSGDTTKLKHVTNIKDGVVRESDEELNILDNVLLPAAESNFLNALTSGVSGEYSAALASGKTVAVLENLLSNQKNELETRRNDLQYIMSERFKRMKSAQSLSSIYSKIDLADGWKKQVKEDAFSVKALQSDGDYIIWLKETAKTIKEGDPSLDSELDHLKDKKSDLQQNRQAALDDNDLSRAADLEAQIQAADQDIQREIDSIMDELSGNTSAGRAAELINGLGDSLEGLTDELLDKAKGKVNDGDFDSLSNTIDALAGLGATDALKELRDAMEGTDAPSSLMNELEAALEDAEDGSGEGGEDGDGSGASDGGSGSESDLAAAVKNAFGASDTWSDADLAVVTIAMARLNEKGSSAAGKLAKQYLDEGVNKNNKYIYKKYTRDHSKEYVAVKTLAKVTSYRYVYDDSRQSAILTKGSTVYTFTTGSAQGLLGADTISLKTAAVFMNGFYLDEADTLTYLKCGAQYVTGKDYAVCYTQRISDRADAFLETLE
ncbi:MAG: hypothetical protein K6A92_09890 [Lachnospiraceae bacterium]|nr:hypothetical protein [Lachnospiraceae bacterium]